jgi:hypothetical protein
MPYDIVHTYPPNLDYDPVSDRLFFNAGNRGGLYSSKIDGSDFQLFQMPSTGAGQDIDLSSRRLFYFSGEGVASADLDGNDIDEISVDLGPRRGAQSLDLVGLAVDAVNSTIYFGTNQGSIYSIGYDGSNLTRVFTLESSLEQHISLGIGIRGLAFDSVRRDLYWNWAEVGVSENKYFYKTGIGALNLESSTTRGIITHPGFNGIAVPIRDLAFDYQNQEIWWTSNGVYRASSDGSNVQQVFSSPNDPTGLAFGPSTIGFLVPPTDLNSVPEPTSLVLVAIGIVAFGLSHIPRQSHERDNLI